MSLISYLQYSFVQNALIATIFTSIVVGIIGVIVINKKQTMIVGGIAHTAFGGIGLGFLLGQQPTIYAVIFAIIAALMINYFKNHTDSDILISVFWSLGMALGVIFIALMKQYPPDMSSYLFGNILTITTFDLKMMVALATIILFLTIVYLNDIKYYIFDEEFSRIINMNNTFISNLVMVMIALAVVILIKVVGIMLVLVLLAIPQSLASKKNSFVKQMFFSGLYSLFLMSVGLIVALYLDLPSGALMVIIMTIIFFFSKIFNR